MLMRRAYWTVAVLLLSLAAFAGTQAQSPAPPADIDQAGQFQPLDSLQGLSGLNGPLSAEGGQQITVSAEFFMDPAGKSGQLAVTAELAPGWHIYSVTQRPGGPVRTDVRLQPSDHFRLVGDFRPSEPPEIRQLEFFPVPVEEHHDKVTWTAPIELAGGVDPQQLRIEGQLLGQVCREMGSCIPLDQLDTSFVARLSGAASAPGRQPTSSLPAPDGQSTHGFRLPHTHTVLTGQLSPRVVAPGQRVRLAVTATPDPGWHVYALKEGDEESIGSTPTVIGVIPPARWTVGPPVASCKPITKPSGVEGLPDLHYYESPVSWTIWLEVPGDAAEGTYELAGLIGYQACKTACDFPAGARFSAQVRVAPQPVPGSLPLQLSEATYKQAAELSSQAAPQAGPVPPTASTEGEQLDLDRIDAEGFAHRSWLPVVMLLAFAAGFVLNFMPCVLPVVGLKIMAFVHQAGQSRGRIFLLNLWYCAGLIFVFLVLATLAVFFGLGWGEQFTSATFNIILMAIVFVFALSFLGVWVIPIPGFVGTGKVNDLAAGEGPSGAFFKGVLTTILATPCSGPMLAPALAYFMSQPPHVAYLGFASAGFGMASPYLLIGAFPKLVSFLPKPGGWMDTFEHIMGFVLLGTVVFLLTFLDQSYVVPTVAMLMGLWAAFWWIGRVPPTEPLGQQLRAWSGGAVFAAMVGLFAFGWLSGVMESRFQHAVDRELASRNAAAETAVASDVPDARAADGDELPWQPYSYALLEKLTAEQKTVLVDFTADW